MKIFSLGELVNSQPALWEKLSKVLKSEEKRYQREIQIFWKERRAPEMENRWVNCYEAGSKALSRILHPVQKSEVLSWFLSLYNSKENLIRTFVRNWQADSKGPTLKNKNTVEELITTWIQDFILKL